MSNVSYNPRPALDIGVRVNFCCKNTTSVFLLWKIGVKSVDLTSRIPHIQPVGAAHTLKITVSQPYFCAREYFGRLTNAAVLPMYT